MMFIYIFYKNRVVRLIDISISGSGVLNNLILISFLMISVDLIFFNWFVTFGVSKVDFFVFESG